MQFQIWHLVSYLSFVAVFQQLKDYEQKIFGSTENSVSMPTFSLSSLPSFSFGFPKPNDPPVLVPVFNNSGSTSIFSHQPRDIPQEFSFGAVHAQENTSDDITNFNATTNISDDNDIPMDGSWQNQVSSSQTSTQ